MVNAIAGCERYEYPAESCLSRWATGKLRQDELCPRCADLLRVALENGVATEQQEQR
jgi:hypothetical protein